MTDRDLASEPCAFMYFAGSRYGPTPEPREYCGADTEPGSDYCREHRLDDEENS